MRRDRNVRRTKLQAIIRYIPAFVDPAIPVGEWMYPDTEPGSFSAPWFVLSETTEQFVADCYAHGWVLRGFDWAAWAQTRRAQALRDDLAMVASATEHELAQLLTVVIRQSRFVEGALPTAFRSGLILVILERMVQLAMQTG